MKKIIAATLSIGMLLGLSACGEDAHVQVTPTAQPSAPAVSADVESGVDFSQKVTVTMAVQQAPGSAAYDAFYALKDVAAELSNGAIEFDIYDGSTLGNESELMIQTMDGTIDASVVGFGAFSRYTDALEAFQLPFLITDYEQEFEMYYSPEWTVQVKKAEEATGLRIAGISDPGMRGFASVNKQINSMADMAGMKIRAAENTVIQKALTNCGASPVAIPFTELYTSLQNKVADAEDINISTVHSQKHYEVCKYYTEVGFYPFTGGYVFNAAFVDSLPEGYWDVIVEATRQTTKDYFYNLLPAYEQQARKECEEAGMVFTTIADHENLEAAVESIYEEYRKDPDVAAFIEAARAYS